MISFTIALVVLILGYLIYGTIVTRIFGIDANRKTPAITMEDGVDYIQMPTWRVFLVQFLNIAGLGPIFGAIMGVMFGPAAFLWIVFGTIFAGAVHDFFSAMMSLRLGGLSWPQMIGSQLGKGVQSLCIFLSLSMLLLLTAVFVFNPADLLAKLTPNTFGWLFWVIIIFLYYIAASMLPMDKLIGRLYPIFGLALLFMAGGLLIMLYVHGSDMPEIWDQFYNHTADPETTPIFPMMFVSIACGAISGFHATQSPLMARCIKTERHGRAVFYGAMVVEGLVALIWAGATVAFCGGYDGVQAYMATNTPSVLVSDISISWLGSIGGILALLGVILAPITSGDTALRSSRLIISDLLKIPQKNNSQRIMTTIPQVLVVLFIMLLPYQVLWRYFAWFNQLLAVFTLWAISIWLVRYNKPYYITVIPALFMTTIVVTYILFAPEGLGLIGDALFGTRLGYIESVCVGIAVSGVVLMSFRHHVRDIRRNQLPSPE